MNRKLLFVWLMPIIIFCTSCGDDSVTRIETRPQYVITFYSDNNPDDLDWFKVIDIKTQKFQPVPAVKELEGQYYLPIMSRMPSFNNKVVEGEFFMDKPMGSVKPDTVFKVTRHLRDTLFSTH
jgi:hypothetical protein